MKLDEFFQKSIVVNIDEDQFFICGGIKITGSSVLFYDSKVFSLNNQLQQQALSNTVDIFGKKSFTQSLDEFKFNKIGPIDQFSTEKFNYLLSPPKYLLILTIEINGEFNELTCNCIYSYNNILIISNANNYEFLDNYSHIAFNKKYSYQGETWQDYKAGLCWNSKFGDRQVDFKILHNENIKQISLSFSIAKKLIKAIDLNVQLPANESSFLIQKKDGYQSAEIVINKLFKEVELLRITKERFKVKDSEFKYSYDWFKRTKTERYSKRFLTDLQAEKCFRELNSLCERENDEFTINGFARTENEATDWD